MEERPDHEATTSPTILLIYSLGPLTIKHRDPQSGKVAVVPKEKLYGKGGMPALELLGILLSQSDRTATRDWVLEQLWPEAKKSQAEERLNDVVYDLRARLRHPSGPADQLVDYVRGTRGSAGVYSLAAYPRIWHDAEAFLWHMQHAALYQRMNDDPLPCLETAYQIGSRGTYLAEKPYSDWAKPRREELEGAFRLCVHQIGRLYLERGSLLEAELAVRKYWTTHMTDEDALRLLMDILGEQQRYQEAFSCYQQTCRLRQEEGEAIDPRTQDLAEYWRTKPLISPVKSSASPSAVPPSPSINPSQIIIVSSKDDSIRRIMSGEADTEELLKKPTVAGSVSESTDAGCLLKAGSLLCQEQLTICQQQQKYIQDQIQRGNMMSDEANQPIDTNPITRRDLIELAFVTSPVLANMQRERPGPFMVEEFLSEATTSITACWHLQDDGLSVVERGVSQYLPLLEELVKHSSLYRQRASYLAAQAYLLLDSVAYHRLRFADGIGYCEKAVEYAHESGDLTLLLVALEELGSALRAHGPETKMIAIYQQAEHYSANTELSGILRSKVRSGLGLASAQQGKSEEVTQFLDEARALFMEDNTELPVFLVGCHTLLDIILSEGRGDLALGDHELKKKNANRALEYYNSATEKFAGIEQLPSGIIVPPWSRVKIDNYRALAYAKAGNLTQFEKYFIEGANGAKALGSKKREQEAWDNLLFVLHRYPHEMQVRDLVSVLR